jgi:hypothetical protein
MWKKVLCLLPAALPWLVSGGAEASATPCSTRAEVLTQLAAQYKETPAAVGLASNGGLIEVLTNGDGATWTIIITMPNGATCLVAAGESWQPVVHLAADESGV